MPIQPNCIQDRLLSPPCQDNHRASSITTHQLHLHKPPSPSTMTLHPKQVSPSAITDTHIAHSTHIHRHLPPSLVVVFQCQQPPLNTAHHTHQQQSSFTNEPLPPNNAPVDLDDTLQAFTVGCTGRTPAGRHPIEREKERKRERERGIMANPRRYFVIFFTTILEHPLFDS